MITFFTTTKNFEGEFKVIQSNAISSWRSISPEIQIIIIGNSVGSEEFSISINAEFVPDVKCSPEGTPLLSDLFAIAQSRAINPIMAYINADIILPQNFLVSMKSVTNNLSKFLIVGHRWDMNVSQIINFNNENEITNFWNMAKNKSQKHGCSGIDYFIFKRWQFKNIPDFIIGRWGWDNWLIWKARRSMVPVIDASDDVQVIHQNHSYKFHNIGNIEHSRSGDEFKNNYKLSYNKSLNILDATYKISNGKYSSKTARDDKIRYWNRLSIIFPELSLVFKIYRRLYKLFNF